MALQNLFNKRRIQFNNMFDDLKTFVKQTYKQSEQIFTNASPWGQIINVFMNLFQMIMFYIEDSITELFITKASRQSSIHGIARLAGHDSTRAIAAMGDIALVRQDANISIEGTNVIIPNLTTLRCKENGFDYLVVLSGDELRLNVYNDSSKQVYLKVIQGKIESQQFTGTGYALQSYECNIQSSKSIDQFFINVFVNGEKWKKYDSMYDIPKGTKGYILKNGITSGIAIYFGTANFGTVPSTGNTITVEYLVTQGFEGNIHNPPEYTMEFVDSGYDSQGNEVDLNSLFKTFIATPIDFGSNAEATALTKIIAPDTSRSFVLANPTNYRHFFEKMNMFSYIDCYTKYDSYDVFSDMVMYLMLIPDLKRRLVKGEDYFTMSLDYFNLTVLEKYKLQTLIEESGQKMLGSVISFKEPEIKKYSLNLYINAYQGTLKTELRDKIITALSNYLIMLQRVKYLSKSEFIKVLNSIDGIASIDVNFISEDVEGLLFEIFDDVTAEKMYINTSGLIDLNLSITNDDTISIEEKMNSIYNNLDFQDFLKQYFDFNGNIVVNEGELAVIRGDWNDRKGNYYNDFINENKLSSVNIYFLTDVPKN